MTKLLLLGLEQTPSQLSIVQMQRNICWRATRSASEDLRQHPPYALEQCSSQSPGKWQGSCFCGSVKFEAFDDPKDNKVCHCVQCQRLHGENLCKPLN